MRNAIVTSLVVVCVLGHARASVAQQLTGGLKGGVTAASLPGIDDGFGVAVDSSTKWGATLGIFVTARLNDIVAFQPEVLYAMRGGKVASTAVGSATSLTFDARYLELPLLLKAGRASQPFYFVIGPAPAFRLAAEGTEVVDGVSETRDVGDLVGSFDIGLVVGVGATFDRFLIEGRWTEGLRNIEKSNEFDASVRNRTFALLAGVRF